MDKTITRKLRNPNPVAGGPMIMLADWYQFGPRERAERPCVESRMLLWCQAGKGHLRINGIDSPFLPGDWVLLPWRHDLVYQADAEDPFLVGGVHVIPHHDAKAAAIFRVAHRKDDPLARHPARRDARWLGLEGIVRRRFSSGDALEMLARYILEKFQQTNPQRTLMSQLAVMLIDEMKNAAERESGKADPLPTVALRRVHAYAETRIRQPLSIEDLATSVGSSQASMFRWFREHLNTSPGKWLSRLRIQKSAALLRTTTLSISEVAERVGFIDPFHFSRVFKREKGVSPRMYREKQVIL